MSFLLGAFGKLSAHREKRDIQAKMMRNRQKLSVCTRQIGDMDKYLQKQEKLMTNQAKAVAMKAKQDAMNEFNADPNLTADTSKYNQAINNAEMVYQQYISQAEVDIQNQMEYLRQTQYQPLKDEEDLLNTEKLTLESQLEIAQQDYEACQKMEQDGAKDLAPKYTAGGN